jgi:hypothetical protein
MSLRLCALLGQTSDGKVRVAGTTFAFNRGCDGLSGDCLGRSPSPTYLSDRLELGFLDVEDFVGFLQCSNHVQVRASCLPKDL